MSKIYNFKEWSLNEQNKGTEVSALGYSTLLSGASKSSTTNKTALDVFMQNGRKVANSETMDENKALIKGQKSGWSVGDKTIKAKDYLKIGELILDGSKGQPTAITVTKDMLFNSAIEASGNGIFALGRTQAAARDYYESMRADDKIIIVINKKNTDSFYANVTTGFQSSIANFYSGCASMLIGSSAIIPNPKNNKDNTEVYKRWARIPDGEKLTSESPNKNASPSITQKNTKEIKARLLGVNKIDGTEFYNTVTGKKLAKYNDSVKSLVESYVNTFFDKHIEAMVARYKSYIITETKAAGISSNLFSDFIAHIDKWKESESAKKANYLTACLNNISERFEPKTTSGSVSRPSMKSSGEAIAGTEGDY